MQLDLFFSMNYKTGVGNVYKIKWFVLKSTQSKSNRHHE